MKLLGIIAVVLIFNACGDDEVKKVLPVLGNCDVVTNAEGEIDTICPTIPDFEYLNQDSVKITADDMRGKVWVAEFFFATCPTICPVMTTQMKRLIVAPFRAGAADAPSEASRGRGMAAVDERRKLRRSISKHP